MFSFLNRIFTKRNLPSVDLLTLPDEYKCDITPDMLETGGDLAQHLNACDAPCRLADILPGPRVTQYQFSLNDWNDLPRVKHAVAKEQIYVAPIPDTELLGLDLPNKRPHTIRIRPLVATHQFRKSQHKIPLVMGVNVYGTPIYADLTKMPHLFISGRDGSGKTTFLQSVIASLLYHFEPNECRLMIINTTSTALPNWDGIPHLVQAIRTMDAESAKYAMRWVTDEIERRYRNLMHTHTQNITEYNQQNPNTKIPYIVVIIDELADIAKPTQESILKITQTARAVGIHMVCATDRLDDIPRIVRDHFPTRAAFQTRNAFHSKMILGDSGAETLMACGDMLLSDAGREPIRIHTAYIDPTEINAIVRHWYNKSAHTPIADTLYAQAVDLVVSNNKPSVSFLQRHLNIGYNKAFDILVQMEKDGIVSAPDTNHIRHVL